MVEPNTNTSSSQTSYFDMPTAPAASSSSLEGACLRESQNWMMVPIRSQWFCRRGGGGQREGGEETGGIYCTPIPTTRRENVYMTVDGYKQKMLKRGTGVVINRREHHHNNGCHCIWLRRKEECKQEWEEGNPGGTASTNQSGSISRCLLWFNSEWCPVSGSC